MQAVEALEGLLRLSVLLPKLEGIHHRFVRVIPLLMEGPIRHWKIVRQDGREALIIVNVRT